MLVSLVPIQAHIALYEYYQVIKIFVNRQEQSRKTATCAGAYTHHEIIPKKSLENFDFYVNGYIY